MSDSQLPRIPVSPEPSAVSENLPTPYNNNRITPDEDGVWNQIGAAAQDAGKVTVQIAQKQQEIADKAKNDADKTAVLQGDATAQVALKSATDNFSKLTGDDAHAAFDKTVTDYDKVIQDTAKSMQPDQAKAFLDNRAPLHKAALLESLNSHLVDQNAAMLDASEKANASAATNTVGDAASRIATDPNASTAGIDNVIGQRLQMVDFRTHGMPQDVRDQARATEQQRLVGVALNSMISQAHGDDPKAAAIALQKAQSYFEENKDVLGEKQGKEFLEVVKAAKTITDVGARVAAFYSADDAILPSGYVNAAKIHAETVAALKSGQPGSTKYIHDLLEGQEQIDKQQKDAYHQDFEQVFSAGQQKSGRPGVFKMPDGGAAASDGESILAKMNRLTKYAPELMRGLEDTEMQEVRRQLASARAESAQDAAEKKLTLATQKTASIQNAGKLLGEMRDNPDQWLDPSVTAAAFHAKMIGGVRDPSISDADASAPGIYRGGFTDPEQLALEKEWGAMKDRAALAKARGETAVDKVGEKIDKAVGGVPNLLPAQMQALNWNLSQDVKGWLADQRRNKIEPTGLDVEKHISSMLVRGTVTGASTGLFGTGLFSNKQNQTRLDFKLGVAAGTLPPTAQFVEPTTPYAAQQSAPASTTQTTKASVAVPAPAKAGDVIKGKDGNNYRATPQGYERVP